MLYYSHYPSPLGDMLIAADDNGLTGLWFEDQMHYGDGIAPNSKEADLPVFQEARRWLDLYFSGENPKRQPPFHFDGTAFQNAVWEILCQIPYGETVTYGEIAQKLAMQTGSARMSAQAVGNAVGRNRLSVLVPCHRVVGKRRQLTGYAGGLDRKAALLQLEKKYNKDK